MSETRIREGEVISPRAWRAREDTADLQRLADWLDTRFAIPGTNWRFGLDSIIGLVPGIGDLATTALGAYIIVRARELGAARHVQVRMAANLAVDALVGAIPLVGDIFDFAYRSNVKNVRLLLNHLEQREQKRRR